MQIVVSLVRIYIYDNIYNVLVKTHILGTHLNRRIRRPPLIKVIGRVPFKLVSCVGNTDQFDSHTLKGMEAKQ